MEASFTKLVADVGGTNTRIALFDPATGELRALDTFINRDFQQFEDVIAAWLDNLQEPLPRVACIAVAAPPTRDRVNMVNVDWSFSRRELASRFGFDRFNFINDFEGNAYALPHLRESDICTLRAGCPGESPILATLGPGTGLGGATLETSREGVTARACEPGHMGLSPGNELELEMFRLLLRRFDDVYAELLVSGPGLRRLYETLGEIHAVAVSDYLPAEISSRALEGSDKLCVTALESFCALLGSICGDFVLANGAYGGLYLAGGFLPGMIPFLADTDFQRRFHCKGAMGKPLEQVPVHVITAAQPGLIGAAHAPWAGKPGLGARVSTRPENTPGGVRNSR